MLIYEKNSENIPVGTDAYYEVLASQEELYLEETEEEVRVILESDDPAPYRTESIEEEREHAAEALIDGDSDDPPLSEADLEQMLRVP
jgi:hypothetical protein